MKTRTGFVSNSSTTSFLLAVKKPTDELHYDYLKGIEFIIEHVGFKKDDLDFFCCAPSEKAQEIKEEIEELEADRKYCEDQIQELKELIEKSSELSGLLDQFLSLSSKPKYALTKDEQGRKWEVRSEREYVSCRSTVKFEIESKNTHIIWLSKKIDELKGALKNLEGYDDSFVMVGFKCDRMSDYGLESMVQWLLNNGKADLVEKAIT